MQLEHTSPVRGRADPDLSAVQSHHMLGEAEADPGARLLGREERNEDIPHLLLGNSVAAVFHREDHLFCIHFCRKCNKPGWLSPYRLQSILYQVDHHLFDHFLIHEHLRNISATMHTYICLLAVSLLFKELSDPMKQGGDRCGFRFELRRSVEIGIGIQKNG